MFKELLRLVEHQMDLLKEQDTEKQQFEVTMPIIKITEAIGKIGTGDREALKGLLSSLGQYESVSERIQAISKFVSDPPAENVSMAKVLSHILLLDIMTNILNHFQPSAAGFTFEAFLAALFEGQQIPVGAGSIQDIIDADDKPISLKLLTEKNKAYIEGSFNSLVNHFVDPKSGTGGKITYLACLKTGTAQKPTGIKFYQLDFTAQNFLQILLSETKKNIPLLLLPDDVEETSEFSHEKISVSFSNKELAKVEKTHQEIYKLLKQFYNKVGLQHVKDYIEGLKIDGTKIIDAKGEDIKFDKAYKDVDIKKKRIKNYLSPQKSITLLSNALKRSESEFWGLMSQTAGFKGDSIKSKFFISYNFYSREFEYLGEIKLEKDSIHQLAEKYASKLEQQIFDIFKHLNELTNHINKYFFANQKDNGLKAIESAENLSSEIKKHEEKVN